MDKKAQNEKEPLTLDGLARYSREVLLPAIDERFERIDQRFKKVATKEDVAGVKTELKQEIAHVRGAVLTALDENTELLCTMRQEQDATSQAIIGNLHALTTFPINHIDFAIWTNTDVLISVQIKGAKCCVQWLFGQIEGILHGLIIQNIC